MLQLKKSRTLKDDCIEAKSIQNCHNIEIKLPKYPIICICVQKYKQKYKIRQKYKKHAIASTKS